jgi:hypothetical protein
MLPYRYVLLSVGIIEITISILCFMNWKPRFLGGLIAWIACSFLIYRLGRTLLHITTPCNCLGTLTDALRVSPQTADLAAKIISVFLLIVGFALFVISDNEKSNKLHSCVQQ